MSNGHFVHFFVPENLPRMPKHAIFVLDTNRCVFWRNNHQKNIWLSIIQCQGMSWSGVQPGPDDNFPLRRKSWRHGWNPRKRECKRSWIPIFSIAFGREADFKFLRQISEMNNGFARRACGDNDATFQVLIHNIGLLKALDLIFYFLWLLTK